MKKDLILLGAFSGIEASAFPGRARAKITFCDDQPNANGYGIEYEDFDELKQTLIGAPIKMKFLGAGVGDHRGSIPIGHIDGFEEEEEDGIHRLNITASLYEDDYPEEVEFLRDAFANKKAPGVSYEVSYHQELVKNGIKWVKDHLVARAATFVRSPAYGNRTALLALASNNNLSPEEFMTELVAMANKNNDPIDTNKGGTKIMTDEEIQKLRDDLATARTALAEKETELAAKVTEITTLTESNRTLEASITDKDTKLASYEAKEVLASRQAKLTEAGITLEIKPERLSKMAEEDFNEYVEDLKTVYASKKGEKKVLASTELRIPKLTPPTTDSNLSSLMEKFQRISRQSESAETE